MGDVQEGRGKTVPYHTRELSLGRLVRRRSGGVHYGLWSLMGTFFMFMGWVMFVIQAGAIADLCRFI